VNCARNRIKQAKGRLRHEARSIDDPVGLQDGSLQSELPDCGESVVERLEKKEVEARVQACIRTLEPDQREVLILRDIQGFSYEEIGGMLKLPDGTVKSRLFRARAALKDCLVNVLGDWP